MLQLIILLFNLVILLLDFLYGSTIPHIDIHVFIYALYSFVAFLVNLAAFKRGQQI